VVSFMPQTFYHWGKSLQYPLDRSSYPLGMELDRPQSCSGCSEEETNSQPLPGIKPTSSKKVKTRS